MFAKIQYKGSDVERQTFPWVCRGNHQDISVDSLEFPETKLS